MCDATAVAFIRDGIAGHCRARPASVCTRDLQTMTIMRVTKIMAEMYSKKKKKGEQHIRCTHFMFLSLAEGVGADR